MKVCDKCKSIRTSAQDEILEWFGWIIDANEKQCKSLGIYPHNIFLTLRKELELRKKELSNEKNKEVAEQ